MKLVKTFDKKIEIGDFSFEKGLMIIAGPCSIENQEQMFQVCSFLEREKIPFLRAAAYKPRTSPYSFQGLGTSGLEIIKKIKQSFSIQVISEIVDLEHLNFYRQYVDVIQIGARNMQNFEILKALGKTDKPIILKRGFGNTIEEWLYAAEYLLASGNEKVILCERGIRTFEPMTRNTLDVGAIALVKTITKLPVIADPSHAAGRHDLVAPLTLAALAAGADGVMLEIHPSPSQSVSDREQALGFEDFSKLLKKIQTIGPLFTRDIIHSP